MRHISIKSTSLWSNLDHIAAILGNFDASVYKCAHFYEKGSVLPQFSSYDR